MRIWLNGKEMDLEHSLTVAELVDHLGLHPAGVAVAVNDLVIFRQNWSTTVIREGDRVEVVRAMQGGSDEDALVIAGHTFHSRLFVGTGKYRTPEEMKEALVRSGTEMVTVAIRYMDLSGGDGGDILRHLDLSRYRLLPNTAGAYTADQAVKMAFLAREALGTNWIKLEVIGDPQTLLPDLQGTLEAARRLVKEGFVVLPYTTSDLITALRLEDAGCAAVMPLAAPIGTGQGLVDWAGIRRVIERVKVPVIVDAGLGCPTDACRAMELGADAVLINTAIARAQDPPRMAEAMKWAVIAGRQGFLAGRMPIYEQANPSSPTEGVPVAPIRRAGEVE
ncbi:MAG TPA: sulfur carrier protein ThiS [Symbiobacteriaceae bacterium]